ncbi:MAG: cyclic-phosphate processing receiver domain-containing protein [Opitutaceae bacterium]
MPHTYGIYLDDIRHPPQTGDDWVLCRTVDELCELLEERGIPGVISFDYELGRTDPSHCGYDAVERFLDFIIKNKVEDGTLDVEIRLHTSSGYGASRMAQLLRDRQSQCEEAGIRLVHSY